MAGLRSYRKLPFCPRGGVFPSLRRRVALPLQNPPQKFTAAASGRSAAVGLIQAILYAVRIGLAYLVMLAVMSFNGGVFLAAVGGYGVGFFFFGSRAFDKRTFVPSVKNTDLPPMNCC
ncbi:hypothetical protein ACP275_14G176400 [Erythranthe tilingii]